MSLPKPSELRMDEVIVGISPSNQRRIEVWSTSRGDGYWFETYSMLQCAKNMCLERRFVSAVEADDEFARIVSRRMKWWWVKVDEAKTQVWQKLLRRGQRETLWEVAWRIRRCHEGLPQPDQGYRFVAAMESVALMLPEVDECAFTHQRLPADLVATLWDRVGDLYHATLAARVEFVRIAPCDEAPSRVWFRVAVK